jgi:hypothetical protein
MSYLGAPEANHSQVHQEVQNNNGKSTSWWNSPALWIMFGAMLATGAVLVNAWGALKESNFTPIAPSTTSEPSAPASQTLELSPYIPVIGT